MASPLHEFTCSKAFCESGHAVFAEADDNWLLVLGKEERRVKGTFVEAFEEQVDIHYYTTALRIQNPSH
jgi:hypothetical protein